MTAGLLKKIDSPEDIKKLNYEALNELAAEIREYMIEVISKNGGHLAPNLGVVELTLALHKVFNCPKDKIIWDVGHQSYIHKIITGRREAFKTLRQYNGISGFPKIQESKYDAFGTGHSSTSISAALGMVIARDLKGEDNEVVAVIGDGSMTGGMAYEALNNAGDLQKKLIVVLNDNEMSIAKNVGAMSDYLYQLRTAKTYTRIKKDLEGWLKHKNYGENIINIVRRVKGSVKYLLVPGSVFEHLGFKYYGPVDGHNLEHLVEVFETAKQTPGPVIIHVITKKGKGYEPAEKSPNKFHGTGPFEIKTGKKITNPDAPVSYTEVFGKTLVQLAKDDKKIVAITAAMPDGTGLKRFRNMYPDRFFDVGIAEEHAVTFAAGLAAGGMKPIVAVYSSFLQRAYDQILHDVCIQNLPVVFAIDRAGLVGSDGETHQGIFDYTYLSGIPNMHICAPKNKWELSDMMKFAVALEAPIAVRYPRGTAYAGLAEYRAPIELGKAEWIVREGGIALFAVGSMVKTAEEVQALLHEKGYRASIINARFIKPIDEEAVLSACEDHDMIVTMEENVLSGGFGEKVLTCLNDHDRQIKCVMAGIPDAYVEHGNVDLLKKEIGLDAVSITEKILEKL